MPDTPVAPPEGGPYDPSVEQRFSRLEADVHDLKSIAASTDVRLANMDARLTNMDARLTNIDARLSDADRRSRRLEEMVIELRALFTATLPHQATKADLADVRSEL